MSKIFHMYLMNAVVLFVAGLTMADGNEPARIKMARESYKASMNFDTAGFEFDIAKGPFEPKKHSFGKHYVCPDWFRDAKFGIWTCWGLSSVPGFDGHYARFMYHQHEPQAYRDDQTFKRTPMSGYKPGRESVYEYHVKNFGHPSKFGYKDFIPLWKAEKFDAMELTALFKQAGARYVGAIASFHDNFDLFNSTHHRWNSAEMGPEIDVIGEWKKACDAQGLRFAATSHLSNHGHEHVFFQGQSDTTGPLKGVPYDVMDPAYEDLYGRRTADRLKLINPHFAQQWYLRMKDLIDKYDPDLFYLDGGLPNGDYGLNLAAHFYNHNIQMNGKLDGVFTIKRRTPAGFTLDMELSGLDKIQKKPWQTDTTLNPGWFYLGKESSTGHNDAQTDDTGAGGKLSGRQKDMLRLDVGKVVDNLIDIVSKNGNMMLNVGLSADGSLPETFRDELVKIGRWMKINGEGIYGTRPFTVFGEGSFVMPKNEDAFDFSDHRYNFTSKDIRFTTKGDTLYAYLLAYPEDNKVTICSLATKYTGHEKIISVKMLGTDEELVFEHTPKGLIVILPKSPPCDYAYGLRICGLQLKNI